MVRCVKTMIRAYGVSVLLSGHPEVRRLNPFGSWIRLGTVFTSAIWSQKTENITATDGQIKIFNSSNRLEPFSQTISIKNNIIIHVW
jgi:hypothetical protein